MGKPISKPNPKDIVSLTPRFPERGNTVTVDGAAFKVTNSDKLKGIIILKRKS